MNNTVRKPGKRRVPAIKEHFHLVGGGVLLDALENVPSLFEF